VRLLLGLPLGILIGMALGALGGGGSILAVPALVYVVGLGPKSAVTTSLVVVGVAAIGGMVGHWRGERVRVTAGLLFGVAGIGGSLLGSRLNRAVDPTVLLVAFSGLMLVAAWRMWASARTRGAASPVVVPVGGTGVDGSSGHVDGAAPTRVPDPPVQVPVHARRVTVPVVATFVLAGTVVGLMTGFFGVGGGFIIVPVLVLFLGFGMPEAIGTSLLIIAINSGVALASRLATTGVDWHVAVPFTLAALLGALVGNRVAGRLPSTHLVRSFAALLVVVALYTLVDSVVAPPTGTHARAVPAVPAVPAASLVRHGVPRAAAGRNPLSGAPCG